MSHMVVSEVSEHLRHTLWLGFRADAVTSQLVQSEQNIVLANPGQVALPQGVTRQVSLWLYQVSPNEHLRNHPVVRRATPGPPANDDVAFYPPLGLNLFYLLTPSIQDAGGASDQLADQRVLGRAMQVLHDQSILHMPNKQVPDAAHELHLSLAPRTIDELAQVWEAMQQPYRLSVCYEVRAVRVDSERRLGGGRVAERRTDFAQVGAPA
jgi:hypothetical protein